MSGRAQYEMSAGLKQAQERFAEWRSSVTGRRPIPESLWALAGELAGQHRVFRTPQIRRLDYAKLKRHIQGVAPAGKQPAAPAAAFVELTTSARRQTGCRGAMGRLWRG